MKKLLSVVAVIAVVAFAASSAFATSPLRAVGVEAGYVSPDVEGVEDMGTWTAGVFADFGLPATNLYITPFVNYWNWSETESSVENSFRDIAIGANMKWTIPTSAVRFQPFLAAGVAAHMLNASSEGGPVTFDEGDTKFGFQGGAGFNIGVSQNTNIIGSGWYNIVEDTNHWSLRGGLAWNL
jgi:hypothetical protein